IIWVEGQTEELCCPVLLKKVAQLPLAGTVFVGVKQVGDFEGHKAEKILEIYLRLSKAQALLPLTLGFLFDKECRSEAQQAAFKRRSDKLITLLPRRMYENYLLHADAIANVANSIDGFRKTPVEASEVSSMFRELQRDEELYCDRKAPTETSNWLIEIDGAMVLQRVFSELSETRVSFDKVKHNLPLTEYLATNDPSTLAEVGAILKGLLPKPV
ncbi:MAG TPA: hypothetical protein VGR58_11460, partial [Candidatus Acidoferrum sp.]|nr:hypothetical protein [Candidatus Acidoferrum sp.]